ncbi:hypothetical protein ACN42_g2282 [Penicillium freii]|uniref:Uncharacterized protein n=1 Tax=Penicillium freii TaxID=48697 RepID=A0A117NR27_PENFR|nr:hypothetical protein ACN42_g2282 [Penicillium freii]
MNASADGKRNQAVCPGIMRQRRTISAYDYPGEPPGQPKPLSHQDCCSTGPRVVHLGVQHYLPNLYGRLNMPSGP